MCAFKDKNGKSSNLIIRQFLFCFYLEDGSKEEAKKINLYFLFSIFILSVLHFVDLLHNSPKNKQLF